ncbi:MAG: hypothetical protein LBT97_05975 [Planctomycetota bacterium]|jgi:hypothetical protein|nr:hypothetical protein [Planctomycetota bacterium]
MSAHDHREDDGERSSPYGSPTTAAWIAFIAVAVMLFVVGGYIKSYREFDAYKAKSRIQILKLNQELKDLRTATRERTHERPPAAARSEEPHPEITDLTPSIRRNNHALSSPPTPPPAVNAPSGADDIPEGRQQSSRPGITAESGLSILFAGGRKEIAAADQQARIEIKAMDKDLKRVIVTGGRNRGFSEGRRLELSRNGRWIGDIRVVAISDVLSMCEILHYIARPEPGDAVRSPVG